MKFKMATKMFSLPFLIPLSRLSGGLWCGSHATHVHPLQLFVICLDLLPVCVLSRASRTQFVKGSNVRRNERDPGMDTTKKCSSGGP